MRWLVPLGLLVAALAIAGCGSSGPSVSEGTDLANGREIFIQGWNGQQSCASCHTMEAAGSTGTIGPNLDWAFAGAREQGFEESTFEQVVREQIAYPGIDLGMPADLVEGEDADDVAHFVARCAANVGDAACAPAEGGSVTATDGQEIFAQAGCGSCHTYGPAGSAGTIGPNLDETQPSLDVAIDRVTNGQGQMPSFKDQLSEEQIQAVAEFVAQSAGG